MTAKTKKPVAKKTTAKKPTTKKVDKARQLNIKIINESSWYSLLNR